ncbi:MAG: phospholipid carrier-dependent glycosyltransferase [Chloroflexi bacterium]|nr:phospholipid carrier-dependent glycosyltransferase [Chloroflexota bacterium]
MQSGFLNTINRNERFIPVFLFLLFLVFSIPGVNWGVPALWNPDELVWRVDSALRGEIQFDETEPDFNYPSLPKYVMYGVGKFVYGMGYSRAVFFISVRVLSALLGGLSIWLIYLLAKSISRNAAVSTLAGLLGIASGAVSENARFAHNDMYLLFFTTLAVYLLIRYQFTKDRLWLYGSFFAVGLAASSKYTGGSLILIPLFTVIVINWTEVRKNLLQTVEMLFIGGALSFLGYVLGTPKALFWMSFYFKRVIPALQRYPVYSLQPNSVRGIIGQWGVFREAVGPFAYYLFLATFVWAAGKLILAHYKKVSLDEKQAQAVLILLSTLILFDLPFMVSVNYIPRYFIPFVPFFAVLAALFVKDVMDLISQRQIRHANAGIGLLLAIGITYSFLRLVSTALLFMNDARMPASDYIASLPGQDKVIEYTLYPPRIDKQQFYKARNYPIFFIKYPGQTVPTGKAFEYNQGEQGLIEREVDILVIDTLTYERFSDEYICETNPVECEFFGRLLAGETSFKLVREFTYSLPPCLPRVSLTAVNPQIRIYEYSP